MLNELRRDDTRWIARIRRTTGLGGLAGMGGLTGLTGLTGLLALGATGCGDPVSAPGSWRGEAAAHAGEAELELAPAAVRPRGRLGIARVSITSDGAEGDGDSYSTATGGIATAGKLVVFWSNATNLDPADRNGTSDVFVHDPSSRRTVRASLASGGAEGNGFSRGPSISADGRYVAFFSAASNLVPGDTNEAADVFVHDRLTGTTTRISVASDGTQGNATSSYPSISGDGRFVAFASMASNLVPDDTNEALDVFVHDRETGRTTRASVATGGGESNDASYPPHISGDGRFVVFWSDASNLTPGDSNRAPDVFVHEIATGRTSLVSVAANGGAANFGSSYPRISWDGRFVAFASNASNLVAGDTNGSQDIFVRDRIAGQTRRASVSSRGDQGDADSISGSISGDGRFVAFHSYASTLAEPGPGQGSPSREGVFVHDLERGRTARVSLGCDGGPGNSYSEVASISSDGRLVAFYSVASDLVPDDTNGAADVFVIENPLAP